MSRQMSTITGIVRKARKIPAGPRVSPTLMSTPYFLGISMSCRQIWTPPARMVQTTPSAPSSAAARLSVATTVAGYRPADTILSIAFLMAAKRTGSMSIKAIVASAKAGNERMSRTSPRVKPKLPAPIKAILVMFLLLILLGCSLADLLQAGRCRPA